MKAWAAIVMVSAGAMLPVRAPAAQPPLAAWTVQDAVTNLADPAKPDAVRRDAALWLVARAESGEAREAIERELSLPLSGHGGGGLILDAIRNTPDASPRLFPIVAQRLDRAAGSELPRLLAALSPFRTRDAARLLVTHLDPGLPDAVTQAASSALSRLSGRTDLGSDLVAWSRWLHEAERMSESQWRLTLAQAWARRADDLEAERTRLAADLVSALRRLHLETAATERSRFLAGLIESSTPEVRDLGLELVGRELAASGVLGPEVGTAALGLLDAASPDVRATAAALVRQLAPAGAGEAVAGALDREQNPVAAGALLVAAGRWPTAASAKPALRWMESIGPAHDRAAEALWTLYRAGELPEAAQARVADLVRRIPDGALTPAVCGLIGVVGDRAERERLVPFLRHESAAMRVAAAEALAWSDEHADAILDAAQRHADLFEYAARVVLVHRPTADGLSSVLALPRPDPEVARDAILAAAAGLSPHDLFEVAAVQADVPLRRALLQSLCSPERVLTHWGDDAGRAGVVRGAVALADMLTAAGAPEDALAALLSLPTLSAEDPLHARVREAQAAALIVLGRLDEAAPLEPGAATWFKALAMCLDRPHARDVLAYIEQHFAATLTPEQAGVIAEVRAALPAPPLGPLPEAPK